MLSFVYLFGVSIWNMSRCTNKYVLQVGKFHSFDSKTLHTEWKVYACTKHEHMKGLHIQHIVPMGTDNFFCTDMHFFAK